MSTETLLKLSIIQAELRRLSDQLGPEPARVVRYSASVLNLLRGTKEAESTQSTATMTPLVVAKE